MNAAIAASARRSGWKAAFHLLGFGALWLFGTLVLGNGLQERYVGAVFGIPLFLLLAGLAIVPFGVVRSMRSLAARAVVPDPARRAFARWILAFWCLHALGSCSTLLAAGACQAQGRAAPAPCAWLELPGMKS